MSGTKRRKGEPTPLERLPLPLLEWYHENARTLPWRSDPTPYHVWVSEIMLQQTRVAAVLGYYGRFLEALPTVADLAHCPEDRLMKLWQGLGYYSRARNLQTAARQVMERHGGEFPTQYDDIRALAGVGDYTAGAIASIALGQAVPAVDGNVLRVVSRLTNDRRDVTRPETKAAVTEALRAVIPLRAAGEFNQALMDLGATVCLPNGEPLCEKCPAQDFCAARQAGCASELPIKAPKRGRRVEERRVWLIFREKKVALRQRPKKGLLAGLWEYPNERIPSAEEETAKGLAAEEQTAKEPAAEGLPAPKAAGEGSGLPIPPVPGEVSFAGAGKHIFTHIEWHMRAYAVQAAGEALPPGWVWADRGELGEKYSIPSAFAPFAHLVEERV